MPENGLAAYNEAVGRGGWSSTVTLSELQQLAAGNPIEHGINAVWPAANSVDWLQQRLPKAIGDWLGNAYAEGEKRASDINPRTVAGEMINGAMTFMPAGRMAVPRQGIRAYHGSPYDFDRFDLSRIGTGEGAQAYGHGLYFAENPKVAAEYKAKLSPQNTMEATAQTVAQKYGLDWSNMSKYERASFVDQVAKDPELSAMGTDRFPKGRMYEVNINAAPEQFLDWDRPLSGQNPTVQESLARLGRNIKQENPLAQSRYMAEDARGHDISVDDFNRQFAKYDFDPISSAEMARDAGIPGIRYLDQRSRVSPGIAGSEAESLVREFGSLENALKESRGRVSSAITPEAKSYWSKRLGELNEYPKPTSNYVLFNDKIIDIMKKWGLAGAAIPLAADEFDGRF